MEKLIVIGAGGLGKEIVWAARALNAVSPTFEILGYCDDTPSMVGRSVLGLPVLGTIEEVAAKRPGVRYICGVGKNAVRPRLVERAETAGMRPATVVHPSATVGDAAVIGEGCYVAAGALIGPEAVLAGHVIVNVHASVGHDSVVGPHVQICPGARISGASTLGEGAFVGSNAVVSPRGNVGEWASLSAASFAATPIPARVVAIGVPARIMAKA